MTDIRPFLVNGDWRTGEGTLEVRSPFDDAVVAELGVPTEADVEEAVATASSTFESRRSSLSRPVRPPSTTYRDGSTRRRRRTRV